MPTFDFARPFQFVFEDPAWIKKVLIGAAFQFLGVVTFFLFGVGGWPLLGYAARIIRKVADGDDRALPEWNVGEDFGIGMRVAVIGIVYMLPGLLIYIGSAVIGGILAGAQGGNSENPLPGLIMMGGMCLSFPLVLIGGVLAILGVLRFVETNDLGAAFQIGESISLLKNNFVPLLLALVVCFIANFLSQFGVILCFVGVFATSALANFMQAHAIGQVLKIDRARRGGAPSPAATPRVTGAY